MRSRFPRPSLRVPVAAGLLALAACSDDPTAGGEHLAVDGLALYQGTAEIYRYDPDDDLTPGLALGLGVTEVTILPLGSDGEPIPEDPDLEGYLEVTVLDPSILSWTSEASRGAHDFVEFFGELEGLGAGATSMGLCVGHDGHCDLEIDIPVSVGPL